MSMLRTMAKRAIRGTAEDTRAAAAAAAAAADTDAAAAARGGCMPHGRVGGGVAVRSVDGHGSGGDDTVAVEAVAAERRKESIGHEPVAFSAEDAAVLERTQTQLTAVCRHSLSMLVLSRQNAATIEHAAADGHPLADVDVAWRDFNAASDALVTCQWGDDTGADSCRLQLYLARRVGFAGCPWPCSQHNAQHAVRCASGALAR